jgi:hypothetical protein
MKRFWPASAPTDLTVQPALREILRQRADGGPDAIQAWIEAYARARALGPPALRAPGASDWYSTRMAEFAEAEWDRNLSRLTPRERGS